MPRELPDIELKCECGNPDHHEIAHLWKGYVSINHPDGTTEERWDYLHLNIYGCEIEEGHCLQEIMLTPERAIELRDFLNEMYPKTGVARRVRNYVGCWLNQ